MVRERPCSRSRSVAPAVMIPCPLPPAVGAVGVLPSNPMTKVLLVMLRADRPTGGARAAAWPMRAPAMEQAATTQTVAPLMGAGVPRQTIHRVVLQAHRHRAARAPAPAHTAVTRA
jgi:hypothetical protein